jgi:hypothetical protein
VDADSVKLVDQGGKKSYSPGIVTFAAKKGKSFDLAKLRADLQATRLGKRTSSEIRFLEITATGKVVHTEGELHLKVAGTKDQFLLAEDPKVKLKEGEKSPLAQLRAAQSRGKPVVSVTGRVHGWVGVFPATLKKLEEQEKEAAKGKWIRLYVTDFEVEK